MRVKHHWLRPCDAAALAQDQQIQKRKSCKDCTETLKTLWDKEGHEKEEDAEEDAQLQSLTKSQTRKKLRKKGGTW